jgi:hypothetical protein
MNKYLHNIHIKFFKNKFLIFILIIVSMLFIINQNMIANITLIEGNTNQSSTTADTCDIAKSYNYKEDYWNGFYQAVNHKRGLDIPQVPRDDGTEDTDNVNPIKCYHQVQEGNPPDLKYDEPYASCNDCESRGYSIGQNIDIS